MTEMSKKTCSKCGEEKDHDEFYVHPRGGAPRAACKACWANQSRTWREKNPERYRQLTKEWAERNPEAILRAKLKYHYDITLEEYETLLEAQGGVCAICGGTWEPHKTRFDVDHNHETGVVRGLLCGPCNRMTGQAGEDPLVLRLGADYLEKAAKAS